MSISLASADLVSRIKAIPEFGNQVGFTVGGQDIDPFNEKLEPPFAWIIYVGDDIASENPQRQNCTVLRLNYIVKVAIDYSQNQVKLIDTDLPILHTIPFNVSGKAPSGLPASYWRYGGQTLDALEPDRLVWAQRYSINISI